MSLLVYVVVTKITITFGLSLVYLYLYRQYREKFIGFWFTSWSLFAVHVFLDLLRIKGIDHPVSLLANQIVSVLSVWFLIKGIYSFRGQRISRAWVCGAVIATILSDIFFLFNLPFYLGAIPTAFFFATADVYAGISFVRCGGISGLGRLVTGYALITLGLINSTYPAIQFLPSQFSAFGYFMGSLFEMIIIMGTLVLYFQRIRGELSESEEKFRLLAENARDVIFRYRIEPIPGFEYISPSVYTVTGYTSDEFYACPGLLSLILGFGYDKTLDETLKSIRETPELINQTTQLTLTHKTGFKIWIEQQCTVIYNGQNAIVAIEGIARDITERIRIEQEMLQLNQLRILGETAATIAHEIRNPMTVVRGYLSNLASKGSLKQYTSHFDLMISELDRANTIISDYLSFSRVNDFKLKPGNLNQLLNTLFPLIKSSASNELATLNLELGRIADVLIDERQIKQLVLNLVSNGLEAMSGNLGQLTISTYMKGEKIVLAVQDQGHGMDKKVVDMIGTPFYTTKDHGTGLGLAVCYHIAEQHRAKISISTGCKGTTISIEFNQIES